jgi:hypothetical protein
MAGQFKQLILDEFKPIVLVSASPAANAALERNNLAYDQVFAPHAEAALPPLAIGVKENSPFSRLEGTLTVRFVDVNSYSESEAEAEASLVKALTQHNQVTLLCCIELCFSSLDLLFSIGIGPFSSVALQPR